MKLTLLPFVFLCSCTTKKLKENPACIFDDYMFIAPKVSEEKVFNDLLLQDVIENLDSYTDEEILSIICE
jgi:hypothetical protein